MAYTCTDSGNFSGHSSTSYPPKTTTRTTASSTTPFAFSHYDCKSVLDHLRPPISNPSAYDLSGAFEGGYRRSGEAAGFQFSNSDHHHQQQLGFRFADFEAASSSVPKFDTDEWMESLNDSTTESPTWQPDSDFSMYAVDPFFDFPTRVTYKALNDACHLQMCVH
ncbi:hypothetical protein L1987_12990 [Smallanthus sonchifolius]|uniref:Uncharacterized protein n=1 Tax=Smallanthus sonchifolius TaxID=185202 RepID=A0ACB9JFV2_9ASTR|nr:hypothetical protein L1987_12990 [Smallanthus sonchifolius]